jgi:NDP-sugar pyrophosphorylase family protein
MITQALILAGGLGTRLRPLTETIPKPMVLVRGRPFLEHVLEYLKANHVKRAVLSVGYLSEKISSHFGDGSDLGMELEYSDEGSPKGTGFGVKHAKEMLDKEFFVLYGDSYLPISLNELYNAHCGHPKAVGTISVYSNKKKEFSNNVIVNKTGRVLLYDKKTPDPKMNGVEAGISVFKKEVLETIPGKVPCSFEVDTYPLLIGQKLLFSFMTDVRFHDIGSFQGLDEAKVAIK